MSAKPDITAALERNRRSFARRPSVAFDTIKTRATSADGLLTLCQEGETELQCDMPEILGGTAQAPTPGVLGRACLSACIVMGIRIAAEMQRVPIGEITADLTMDWDNRGMLSFDDISAGPGKVELQITLVSAASEPELQKVVEIGLRNDPWLIALQAPHAVEVKPLIRQKG